MLKELLEPLNKLSLLDCVPPETKSLALNIRVAIVTQGLVWMDKLSSDNVKQPGKPSKQCTQSESMSKKGDNSKKAVKEQPMSGTDNMSCLNKHNTEIDEHIQEISSHEKELSSSDVSSQVPSSDSSSQVPFSGSSSQVPSSDSSSQVPSSDSSSQVPSLDSSSQVPSSDSSNQVPSSDSSNQVPSSDSNVLSDAKDEKIKPSRYRQALLDLGDPLIAVKGHGLIELGRCIQR